MTETTGIGRGRGASPQTLRRRRAEKLARELAALIGDDGGMSWARFGACRDRGDDLFFPAAELGSEAYAEQAAEAKAMCADCPVRAECLEHAMDAGEDDGVWGGLDADERRTMRRARRRDGIVVGPAAREGAA